MDRLKLQSLAVTLLVAAAVWVAFPPFDIRDKAGTVTTKGKINLGLDLQGGMHLILEVDTAKLTENEAKDATPRALEIIRNRIDQFGVMEPVIQQQGKNRILVQLPGVTDTKRAKELIGRTAHLEFKLVSDDTELLKKAVDSKEVPEGYELKYTKSKESRSEALLLEKDAVLTGDMLIDASTEFSSEGFGMPYVSLELNNKGATIFADVTGANVDRRLAVVLDGEIYTAPVIREKIPSGKAQITGNFTVDEAKDIAIILRAGALPAPVNIIEERTVGPDLGKDSVASGIRATLIGGLLVLIFMAGYYLLAGGIANVALIANMFLLIGLMALFKVTLTLPGIAGLVLTIGMSVDANVLIFERIREELKQGKTLKAAIAAGHDRAFMAIMDGNLTTFITGLILFQFGTGPIRGFASVLCMGIATSMFAALIIPRLILEHMTTGDNRIEKLKMMQFFGTPKMSFIGQRKIAYILSVVVIAAGLVMCAKRGETMFGVDFTGGTLQQYQFKEPVRIDKVRAVLNGIGLGDSKIQSFGGDKEIIIRAKGDSTGYITDVLTKEFGEGNIQVMRIETVGPTIGADMKKTSGKALIWCLVGILIYVAFRFEFRFAVTGIVALFHDVLVCLAFLAFSGRELSIQVVAALLTIVGYSINDTIVIFDRIRENRKFMRKSDDIEIFNVSINQTLWLPLPCS
ncbi:MAG: protein translocase subunit SecD [Candidatus Omnitrophica bacterium]|nr:protein translocase subunit SecD [Candidatus Omnitrophota bacterium]